MPYSSERCNSKISFTRTDPTGLYLFDNRRENPGSCSFQLLVLSGILQFTICVSGPSLEASLMSSHFVLWTNPSCLCLLRISTLCVLWAWVFQCEWKKKPPITWQSGKRKANQQAVQGLVVIPETMRTTNIVPTEQVMFRTIYVHTNTCIYAHIYIYANTYMCTYVYMQ